MEVREGDLHAENQKHRGGVGTALHKLSIGRMAGSGFANHPRVPTPAQEEREGGRGETRPAG